MRLCRVTLKIAGFATYISYFGIKSVSPEYDPESQWLTGYRRRALQLDGSVNTHPLVNISSPMFYFDGISYSKGASLLTMMEKFLTKKVFHEALQMYLAKQYVIHMSTLPYCNILHFERTWK